jgi:hypothetical protein
MLALALTACAGSRPSVRLKVDAEPVKELGLAIAQPPAELTAACDAPADLSAWLGRPMPAGPTERLWGVDRAALADCAVRKSRLQLFYANRDSALAGRR